MGASCSRSKKQDAVVEHSTVISHKESGNNGSDKTTTQIRVLKSSGAEIRVIENANVQSINSVKSSDYSRPRSISQYRQNLEASSKAHASPRDTGRTRSVSLTPRNKYAQSQPNLAHMDASPSPSTSIKRTDSIGSMNGYQDKYEDMSTPRRTSNLLQNNGSLSARRHSVTHSTPPIRSSRSRAITAYDQISSHRENVSMTPRVSTSNSGDSHDNSSIGGGLSEKNTKNITFLKGKEVLKASTKNGIPPSNSSNLPPLPLSSSSSSTITTSTSSSSSKLTPTNTNISSTNMTQTINNINSNHHHHHYNSHSTGNSINPTKAIHTPMKKLPIDSVHVERKECLPDPPMTPISPTSTGNPLYTSSHISHIHVNTNTNVSANNNNNNNNNNNKVMALTAAAFASSSSSPVSTASNITCTSHDGTSTTTTATATAADDDKYIMKYSTSSHKVLSEGIAITN